MPGAPDLKLAERRQGCGLRLFCSIAFCVLWTCFSFGFFFPWVFSDIVSGLDLDLCRLGLMAAL
jgi:hypothetical protein